MEGDVIGYLDNKSENHTITVEAVTRHRTKGVTFIVTDSDGGVERAVSLDDMQAWIQSNTVVYYL